MLTSVTVVPPVGAPWSSFEIPVLAPGSGGIFAEKVDGLEPVQAEVSTNAYNELDGEFFVGARVGKRNIVLHMLLEVGRDVSVSAARRQLYGYFMPKLPVNLQFDFTDRDPVMISGYAEDYQGDRFSNDPDAQVSIICPLPNFSAITEVIVDGESEVGTDPPLTDVLNSGDQAVGMQLRITNDSGIDFTGDIHIERMIESSPGVYFSVHKFWLEGVTVPDSATGKYLWFESNKGKKTVEIRDGSDNDATVTNLLGMMTDDSVWPQFYPGPNKFRVVTTGTTGWGTNHLNWELILTEQFGGL